MVFEALGAVLTWDATTLVGVLIAMVSTVGIFMACRTGSAAD